MKRAAALALFPLLLCASVSRDAHADGMVPEKGVLLPVGVNVGYGMNPRPAPNGFLFGGEASIVYFDRLRWIGAYADVIRDFGANETRVSIGPEVGFLFFGLDGGFLASDRGNGVVGRFTVSFLLVHLYARMGHVVDQDTYGELGLLLKLPIPLETWSEPRHPASPPPGSQVPPPDADHDPHPDAPTPDGPLAPDEPGPQP